jgi:hypothetical protein
MLLLFAVVTILSASGSSLRADAAGSLKGKWFLTIQTPFGTLPANASFRPNGGGTIQFGDMLPLVYREDGSNFSVSFEVPAAAAPNGQNATIIIRGTRTSDTTLTGTAILIAEVPDPTSSIGVQAITGVVSGVRQ